MNKYKRFSLILILCSAGAAQAQVTCTAPANLLQWPAQNPVWELCWLPPNQSSGPRGSGLELRNVHYNGYQVLKRAHAPLLFAEYAGSTCYRDWKDSHVSFVGEPAVRNQLGTPSNFSATTSCDRSQHPTQSYGNCPFQLPGRTSGDCFSGVAIEDRGDFVVLTTQYNAAWYYYTSRFTLYLDGSFDAQFGFGNYNNSSNGTTHWHHNVWRFDFDIDGADNNVLSINDQVQTTEFVDRINATGGPLGGPRTFEVRNTQTGRGYRLIPSQEDYAYPVNQSGRNLILQDVIGTVYRANEYTDRGNTNNLGDCALLHGNLANGEDIIGDGSGADVVLYYRTGVRDLVGSDVMICKSGGPMFVPLGNWGSDLIFGHGFEEKP